MKRKKSKFLTFLCSLIPGAGEMYMGFMKMGLSLLSLFIGVIFLASLTGISELIFVAIIIWIYSFFHAHNLAGMPDAEFQALEDRYLLSFGEESKMSENVRKVVAVILILLGLMMMCEFFVQMFVDVFANYIESMGINVWTLNQFVTRTFVALILIIAGIWLIVGKKETLKKEEQVEQNVNIASVTEPKPEESTVQAAPVAELPAPDNHEEKKEG